MEIIYVDFKHPSFNWGNGLYIIAKEVNGELYMCKLNNGQPELDGNGKFMISCTGSKNKGITKTNLKYFTNKELRKEKLKKIMIPVNR